MGARLLSDQGPRDSGLRLQASRGLWIQSQWKMVRRAGHWPPPAACTQHQAPPSQPGLRLTLLLQLIFPKKQLVRGKADWLLLLSQSLGSKRDSVEVKVPAKKESTKESFSPSGWHVYGNKVAETGTRSSVYNVQDEPAIITLDNMAKYLKHSHNSVGGSPDVFDVNVQAVIKTKDAPNT